MFLKTKTIVALNTGQSLWGLFPLKSFLITLAVPVSSNTRYLIDTICYCHEQQL